MAARKREGHVCLVCGCVNPWNVSITDNEPNCTCSIAQQAVLEKTRLVTEAARAKQMECEKARQERDFNQASKQKMYNRPRRQT